MQNIMDQCLSQKLAAIFEELALVCADMQLSVRQSEAPVDVAMNVSFTGPLTGSLILRATSDILPAIADNMLGTNDSTSHTVLTDALGELANVLCGNLLPLVGGAEAVFVLSAPMVHQHNGQSLGKSQLRHLTPSARASIGIDDGRVVAQLMLSESSREALGLNAVAA